MSSNQISDEGARTLSESLKVNNSLQHLNLSFNQIDYEGARTLSESLKVNNSLQQLIIDGNNCTITLIKALQHSLEVNRHPEQYPDEMEEKRKAQIVTQQIEWKPNEKVHQNYLKTFKREVSCGGGGGSSNPK